MHHVTWTLAKTALLWLYRVNPLAFHLASPLNFRFLNCTAGILCLLSSHSSGELKEESGKHLLEENRASLVARWLRICLPVRGTRVRALVWEDPTCRGATGPVSHNCWACASGACAPQQERPRWWEARALRWRAVPTCHNWRKPSHRDEDPTQP